MVLKWSCVALAKQDMIYYVYILRLNNDKIYVGFSRNLKRRLEEHRKGLERYTKNYLPCTLIMFVGFANKRKALAFEKYLKSGSGFAFRNKHFI